MVASTSSATQLTKSADIFGGTLSSPDSLKNGSKTGGTEKTPQSQSDSAKMIGGFNEAIGSLPVVAINSIGAGVQGLNAPQVQPYNYGYPQTPGTAPAAPAAPAASTNATPAASGASASPSGGTTINIGKKPEEAPPKGAEPKKA